MDVTTVKRYVHTVKHLKVKQIVYRLVYLRPKTTIVRANRIQSRDWENKWQAPLVMPNPILDDGRLYFLNETANVEDPNLWNSTNNTRLWLYNLHYFDCLNAKNIDFKYEYFIQKWIDENPPMHGCGWEPYPISLRVVNWVKWFSRHSTSIPPDWTDSLSSQARALTKNIEYHILANHLFANAKALVFAGAFFEGHEADAWLKKGLRILDQEIKEQFLSDGGHFELSPMYHATLLWDMCDLYNLATCTGLHVLVERQARWREVIERGLKWLRYMSHPDGRIAFFNDATFGVAPSLQAVNDYASYLDIQIAYSPANHVTHLASSGFIVSEVDGRDKLIMDVGKVGPEYQPGHAHADTLSFELSLFCQRFIVNSGISTYEKGELRQSQRGTKAHNTVSIDSKDSSDVWAGFRVAKRAYPSRLKLGQFDSHTVITCSHDGYKRLPTKNIHTRTWQIFKNKLIIEDLIFGSFKQAQARFYLHPDVEILSIETNKICCRDLAGNKIKIFADVPLTVVDSCWYPAFNMSKANKCIVVPFAGHKITTRVEWNVH